MSKLHEVSTDRLQEELASALALAKKFAGYRLKENFITDLGRAATLVEQNQEAEASKLLEGVLRGIRNTLKGFFQGSPRFFQASFDNLRARIVLDQDVEAKAAKKLREVSQYAGLQTGIDLEEAARLYAEGFTALSEAEKEQTARLINRKRRLALEEAKDRMGRAEREKLARAKAEAERKAKADAEAEENRRKAAEQRAKEDALRKEKADKIRGLLIA